MKNMITALLCLGSLSASAGEIDLTILNGPGQGRGRPSVELDLDLGGGVSLDFQVGDDGFVSWNDDLYVPTRRECNLKSVTVAVEGGDVEINDLDVVFGNGQTQDIPLRQYFRAGSESNKKRLDGGKRCIVGFKIDANSLNRWRGSRARVTLYAEQVRQNGRTREIELGSARISDYANRREWHGRWGGRDGRGWDNDDRRDRRDRDERKDKVQICIGGICVSN